MIIFSNGNSIDSRSAIHQKIAELKQEGEVRIIPVSADAAKDNCDGDPVCPDDKFLNQIKDEKLENWLDGTKSKKYIKNCFRRKK